MAELYSRFSTILFFLSIFSDSSVYSRTLEQIPKTSPLDVSALFQQSTEILSFNPKSFQIQNQEELQEQGKSYSNSNSSLTLKLYSRDTLSQTPFKNYRDLTLARLKRDTARVNFISKKLNLSNAGNEGEFSPMDVETPLISGARQGVGEYFARFGIGTPAKQFYTTIDTGSDITWIQCSPCTSCYKQADPIFNPATSSSYKSLTCDAPQCKQLDTSGCSSTNKCEYQVGYGDGSSTVGDFATETFTLGGSVINDVALGCGRDNEGLFAASAGLLGLGRGSLSFPSQITQKSFSYCLVDRDSTSASTLSFGSSMASDITTSLLGNIRTFYAVSLTGISVGGTLFSISVGGRPGGPIIVDSGTSITRLPTGVYNVIRDEFVKGTNLPSAGSFSLFDTCFTIPSGGRITVPTVAFHFGANILLLPPKNYLRLVNQNTVCFAFAASSMAIIGNFQQQGFRVSFDLANSLIGFSANKC